MKSFNVDTWLPVFSGFYGTIWETDSDEEREIEDINDKRIAKGLLAVGYDDVEWDYDEYMQMVSKSVSGQVSEALIQLGCIQKGTFQNLRSPREYNFANDAIDVTFTLTPKNVKVIEKYLQVNVAKFSHYLTEHYTSRDGFMSNYSNQSADWLIDIQSTVKHQHMLGAILNFILLNEEGQDYEMGLYEHAIGNGACLYAKNYDKLLQVA